MKYAQVALVNNPTKRMKLTILVVDIPTRYDMLFSRIFYRDMGGEIKIDWSHAIIPMGNNKIKLEPKEKEKFMILNFDDPKAQILYQDMEFRNYMMFTNFSQSEGQLEPPSDLEIWTLEFNGSCATARSRAGMVLISLDGHVTQLAYKLQFKNTNNIA